jgi:hypothetical protein
MSRLLQTKQASNDLVQRLLTAPVSYGQEEPETLAHAFSDLEESLRKFLEEQLPKLADSSLQGQALERICFWISEKNSATFCIIYMTRSSFER